jgi:hypothetical protein
MYLLSCRNISRRAALFSAKPCDTHATLLYLRSYSPSIYTYSRAIAAHNWSTLILSPRQNPSPLSTCSNFSISAAAPAAAIHSIHQDKTCTQHTILQSTHRIQDYSRLFDFQYLPYGIIYSAGIIL